MIRSIFNLTFLLLALLGASFFVHLQVAPASINFNNQILHFYLLNLFMSIATGVAIIYLSIRKSEITGFVFMGGSLIKFALFFMLFYGNFSADHDARKAEFISFYIPYALSLIIEVWYLIRHLNKSN